MISKKYIMQLLLYGLPAFLLLFGLSSGKSGKSVKVVKNESEIITVPSISLGNKTSGASDNFRIDWQVMPGAAGMGSSTSFGSNITMGQTSTGAGTSASYAASTGYWKVSGGSCDCVPGEADGVPPINILDIVYIINYKYKSGPAPIPYALCNADTDCDCLVNILDIVYLINYKYKLGPAPCDCATWTGICGTLR